MDWLVDHVGPESAHPRGTELLRQVGVSTQKWRSDKKQARAYAVRLNELIIRDNRT
jgi:hypothetical protein